MRVIGIFLIATTIISCASTLPPAEPNAVMMDQADTIILTINENPQSAYKNLQKLLGNHGFTVIESAEKPQTVVTTYKTFGPLMFGVWGSYTMKIVAKVEGTNIFLSGMLDSGSEIENSGGKNSPIRNGWNKLVEIATDYPHEKIRYSRN